MQEQATKTPVEVDDDQEIEVEGFGGATSDGDDSFDEIDLKYLNASLIAKIRSGAEVTINGKKI